MRSWSLVLAALLVGAGIAAAGWFASQTLERGRAADNLAEVKGLSERRVDADLAIWSVTVAASAPDRAALGRLVDEVAAGQDRVAALMAEAGFDDGEITRGVPSQWTETIRDSENRLIEEVFHVSATVTLETAKVRDVRAAQERVAALIGEDVGLTLAPPRFLFNGLNAIKPDMLREATQNARIAAEEFAKNAGVAVGGIRSARQGGFSIQDAGGGYGEEKIEKDVRVVTTIEFFLVD